MTRRAGLRRWLRRDDGVSAIEAAILAPALLAILALAIVVMRTEVARQSVQAAAHDAARVASIDTDGTDAASDARRVVHDRLGPDLCHTLTIAVDTSQFANQIGTPATVTVTITCVADFSDVAIPGMPGQTTITASFVSTIDQFRGRQP